MDWGSSETSFHKSDSQARAVFKSAFLSFVILYLDRHLAIPVISCPIGKKEGVQSALFFSTARSSTRKNPDFAIMGKFDISLNSCLKCDRSSSRPFEQLENLVAFADNPFYGRHQSIWNGDSPSRSADDIDPVIGRWIAFF